MISNRCPSHIEPELWQQMSADARYRAQETARAASGLMDFARLLLIAPPLLFILLPPVQKLVNAVVPPSHYVRLNGRADPRKYLNEAPIEEGQRVAGHVVTSGMGDRLHPIDKVVRPHNGVDIATAVGTPLYAISVDPWPRYV